ncbi:LacI family DNA-binding transcriptional regulator [Ilyobacter sp.]|uniref:LacI family DNA-binding transcriptional regulator n=1 Tax=Ilyobacter sp. TaxID=3100343 RepID=UPI003565B70F
MVKSSNKKISSKDVAKLAGVSQSTVSRVFNESCKLISEETRNRVIKAANELGYRPSLIARSLKGKSTKIIGIEINDFKNSYYMKALGMFAEAFQERGFNLMIFNAGESENMEEKLKKALEYQVAGLIITRAILSDEYLEWCTRYHIPIFMFNRINHEKHKLSSVVCDNYLGGEKIGELLYNNGFRNIAFISGDENSSTNNGRESGFSEFLKSKNMTYTKIQGEFSYESGFKSAEQLINSMENTDSIFCASDSIALGVIDYIKNKTSLKIPEDISVVGFDDIDEGGNINYNLTTYKQPIKELIDFTVKEMIDRIENKTDKMINIKLEGEVLIRNSCKILNKNGIPQ